MSRTNTVTTTHVIRLIYLHTYLLTPYSTVPLQKLTGFQLVEKFPAFYGTRRFITAFTTDLHLSLSWVSFRSYQRISPGPRPSVWTFLNKTHFYGEEFLAPRPTPQAGPPHFVGCPRLLIQYIRSYCPYWWPFLHPQPEDAPCRSDRDPLITAVIPLPNLYPQLFNSFRNQQNYANAPGLLCYMLKS